MRYAQLVMGPAGSGKSTYCSTVAKHCATIGRMIQVVNLDPAAEQFDYPVTVDVRELIALEDVMEAEDLKLGPNGGLIFCMEYLAQNFDWLEEQLGSTEDDYVIFDCPGQIELYSHIPVMKRLVETLQQWDFRICSVFLIDSQFLIDCSKFFSGVLCALAAMVQLELPHVNIMTKMDLLTKKQAREVERYLQPDAQLLLDDLNPAINNKFKKLNEALAQLIDDYSLVAFLPLNIKDEDSVSDVLVHIDNTIQYGEDLDVREARELDQEDESEEES